MSTKSQAVGVTLTFDRFWTWLQAHPNCILQAGTPEVSLFDDDDLHWHFASDEDGTLLVQLIRGKKLLGELAVYPQDVTYVQGEPTGESDEVRFELISESDRDRVAAWHFITSHGYDDEKPAQGRWTH